MKGSQRFLFVDGLRGLAAVSVVLVHLTDNLAARSTDWVPRGVVWFFGWGGLGVDVFFVLSGFVIAHSVRHAEPSWRFLGRFCLRRSIRLDPPLWVTIALESALLWLTLQLFSGYAVEIPSMSTLLANLTYTQRFVGLPDISPVFWSLTYEVQFYLVLVTGLVVGRLLAGRRFPQAVVALFWISTIYSLMVWTGSAQLPLRGLFIDRWFQFSLGVGAWAVATRKVRWEGLVGPWLILLSGFAIAAESAERTMTIVVVSLTALALGWVGYKGRMGDFLAGPTLQFLGRISYSLYLIHLSVGWRFMSLARELLGRPFGPVSGTLVMAASIGVSVLAAWLMYMTLERPSMRLAGKVTLPKSKAGDLAAAEVAPAAAAG